jgi:hypothetical protein
MAAMADDLHARLQAALDQSADRPVADADVALHAVLAASAGYFLGEWMAPAAHARLMERLLGELEGLAGLAVPEDPLHALQLAQHVRELTVELGTSPWLEQMTWATAEVALRHSHDPQARRRRWDAETGVRCAAMTLAASRDGHPLLLAHAQRRLWELAQPGLVGVWRPPPPATVRDLSPIAFNAGPHGVQVLEAALAEMSASPALVAPLTMALGARGRRAAPPFPTA